MTVIEVLNNVEEILGTVEVSGRNNVKKVNTLFDMLDATIAALENGMKKEETGGEECEQ